MSREDYEVRLNILRSAYPELDIPKNFPTQTLKELEFRYKYLVEKIKNEQLVKENKFYSFILRMIIIMFIKIYLHSNNQPRCH